MSSSTYFYICSILLLSYRLGIIKAVDDSNLLNNDDQKHLISPGFFDTDGDSQLLPNEGKSEVMSVPSDLSDAEDNQNKQLVPFSQKSAFGPVQKAGNNDELLSLMKLYATQHNSKKQTKQLSLPAPRGSGGNEGSNDLLKTLSQLKIDPSLLADKKSMAKKQPLLALEYNSNKDSTQTGSDSDDEQHSQSMDTALEIYDPKIQALRSDGDSIEEISTDNLMDEREYELRRFFKKLMSQNSGKVFGADQTQNSFKKIPERILTAECAKFAREHLSISSNGKNVSRSYVTIRPSKSNALGFDFRKTIRSKLDRLQERIESVLNNGDNVFREEHFRRAVAFTKCCFSTKDANVDLMGKYTDAYDDLNEQDDMIKECYAAENGLDKDACKEKIAVMEDGEKLNNMYLSVLLHRDPTLPEKLRKRIDSVVAEKKIAKNVVSNYDSATQDYCPHALELLWSPYSLLECEMKARGSFINTADYKKYDQFDRISTLFVNKALSIIRSLQIVSLKFLKPESSTDAREAIPQQDGTNATVEQDMKIYKNSFILNTAHQSHPLIAHFAKRAHAYVLCCKPGGTTQLFSSYITSFNEDSPQGDTLGKTIRKCESELSAQQVDDAVQMECESAYDDWIEAGDRRRIFIDEHKGENPHMLKDLRHALKLEQNQYETIQLQSAFVDQYCPDHHVFDLMFDIKKLVNCETLIRRGLRSSVDAYNHYVQTQSVNFKTYLMRMWTQMNTVIEDLDTDKPAPQPVQTFHRPNIQAQSQLGDPDNGASFTCPITYQCFSLILLVVIQLMFF